MGAFAIFVLVFALAIGLAAAIVNHLDRKGREFWRIVLLAGIPPATVRIAIVWYLTYLNASGKGSYDDMVFVFFFVPEGFVFKRGAGTTWDPFIASAVLGFGSYLWTALMTKVIQQVRRYSD